MVQKRERRRLRERLEEEEQEEDDEQKKNRARNGRRLAHKSRLMLEPVLFLAVVIVTRIELAISLSYGKATSGVFPITLHGHCNLFYTIRSNFHPF